MLDAAGHILADVGGPYVIAPVTGVVGSGGRPGGVDHRAGFEIRRSLPHGHVAAVLGCCAGSIWSG